MANSDKKQGGKKGLKKNTKMLIAVAAAAVVLVGALLAVLFLVPNCGESGDGSSVSEKVYPTDANGRQYALDAKGNKIENDEGVLRDGNGNIISDGVVDITTQGPLLVTKIEIENESGSYTILSDTPKEKTTDSDGNETTQTSDTVYTLVGFEDAAPQSDMVSSIANQASNMATTKIIDVTGGNLKDYGLDKPRAKVHTTFEDGTVVKILIGNEAPDSIGTYIKYEDKNEVYLTDSDLVDKFLFSVLDFLSKDITDSAENEDNAEIESVTLSGKNYPQAVTIVPNDDETSAAFYKMTAPSEQFVNVTNGQEVLSGIRGLYATSVTAYNPSADRLKELGLDSPAAKLEAKYPDKEYTLLASDVDDSGNVYLYNQDTGIAYQLAATSVAWASSSYSDLKYEYVLKPVEEKLSSIEISVGEESYKFDLEQVKSTDDEGNEISSMKIKCGDKELQESRFSTFFDNLTNVQRNDNAESERPSGSAVLTVKYNYSGDKSSDTVEYYDAGNRTMLAVINGSADSHVFESYTSKIIEDAPKAASGGTVTAI